MRNFVSTCYAASSFVLASHPSSAIAFVQPSLDRLHYKTVATCFVNKSSRLFLALDEHASVSVEDTVTCTVVETPDDDVSMSESSVDVATGTRLVEATNAHNRQDTDQSESADVIRDLDGDPLSKEYFSQNMGISNVESYSCPEKDIFRGFMSNACRIRLSPGGETAFYKTVIFKELDHAQEKLRTSPHKLARDSMSYKVVASFLSSKARREVVSTTRVQIPKLYAVQARPDRENPIESKFSFLFEDYAPWDGWYQLWLLQEEDECKAALTALAKIHAFFWQGSSFWDDKEAATELEESVWKSGSYVQPRAQGLDQYKTVAKEWSTKRMKFRKELSSFDFWDNLGERLESIAENVGRHAHPFADDILFDSYKKDRTFTHGDPKQANLFFRRSVESELEVGVIGKFVIK